MSAYLTVEVPSEVLEQVARRAAELVMKRQNVSMSPWLNTAQAAEHLCCTPDRIYDLVALHKLDPRRDGRRLLFRRDTLDAYLEASS
jgi:excisionase family DNA binding protein